MVLLEADGFYKVDEAVMGLSVHTNGDGAGENPLLQRSLFVVATCKLVLN